MIFEWQKRIRKIASSHMCSSASEERIWIELTESLVKEFIGSAGESSSSSRMDPCAKKAIKEDSQKKQPLSKMFMFKEPVHVARAASAKHTKKQKK